MRRVIAMLTDFGNTDWYVAAMKAVITRINSDVMLVDITHEIAPHSISEAAFTLKSCYRFFPDLTVFLAVVDPHVGTQRRPLALRAGRWLFVGPDNGIFGLILESESLRSCVELRAEDRLVSATFHGRDIFAPAAAKLSLGMEPDELGSSVSDPVRLPLPRVQCTAANEFLGEVVRIDRFGNLITNIPAEIASSRAGDLCVSVVSFPGKRISISRLCKSYAELSGSGPGLLVGSTGYLELALFGDSAAKRLGIATGEPVHLVLKKSARHRSSGKKQRSSSRKRSRQTP